MNCDKCGRKNCNTTTVVGDSGECGEICDLCLSTAILENGYFVRLENDSVQHHLIIKFILFIAFTLGLFGFAISFVYYGGYTQIGAIFLASMCVTLYISIDHYTHRTPKGWKL